VGERPKSERAEPPENERLLRVEAGVRLGGHVEIHYADQGAASDICIEGRAIDRASGRPVSGALRLLRLMGRTDHCAFIEIDLQSDEPRTFAFFAIDEDGDVSRNVDTEILTKAAAVADPANSTEISHERFFALKKKLRAT
jgi:hypothetical protein